MSTRADGAFLAERVVLEMRAAGRAADPAGTRVASPDPGPDPYPDPDPDPGRDPGRGSGPIASPAARPAPEPAANMTADPGANPAATGDPEDLVLVADTLVRGVHFPVDTPLEDVGFKAVAVNLSDLAAMGARPRSLAIAVAIEKPDTASLRAIARGIGDACAGWPMRVDAARVDSGPLCVSVELGGTVAPGRALRRNGAAPGDRIAVTGTLGDAGLALAALNGTLTVDPDHRGRVDERLSRPTPRVELGRRLAGIASACIDVSDGLTQDLGHILDASRVGATVRAARLPLSNALASGIHCASGAERTAWNLAATAGDDYELCVTVPPRAWPEAARVARECAVELTGIGIIEATPGLRLLDPDGHALSPGPGYEHFRHAP